MSTPAAPVTARRARLLPRRLELGYRAYEEHYGRLPRAGRNDRELMRELEASGLTGRGGAGFPTVTKLAAAARKGGTWAIANGTEGEPPSAKDAVLLTLNPHLVLDGLEVAARVLGARRATIAVSESSAGAIAAVERALGERSRPPRPELVRDRFVAGEETALVDALSGGEASPTGRRPFERGILVQNVETLANLALVARRGAAWYREAGTEVEPGTALATVLGAVAHPGVLEAELGTPFGELFERCGGLTEPVDAMLVGGYFGTWLPADPELAFANESLRPLGASLGARVVVALPRSACGLTELANVTRYLAGESSGQCGPCVFGLPAVADVVDALVGGTEPRSAVARFERLQAQIARRGACAHPDGALEFVRSGLEVFAGELERHRRGFCSATVPEPVLPVPRRGNR